MSYPQDDGDGDYDIPVTLHAMEWAEVCSALQCYLEHEATAEYPVSRKSALYALRQIDRQINGASELPPPDDVLGPGKEES